MKMFCIAALCLALSATALSAHGLAQTADTDPATKDQVEIFLRTMHTHDVTQRMMEAMLKPMHQMFHDQFKKDGRQLPADFESRINKMMDDLIKDMPMDEMTQAMVPAYQKHFTNGDISNLIAFYSSPTGQKVLQELPEVTSEGMQAMMPVMIKYIGDWKERMQKEVKDMEKTAPKTEEDTPVQK
jgi:uncharacterized protein